MFKKLFLSIIATCLFVTHLVYAWEDYDKAAFVPEAIAGMNHKEINSYFDKAKEMLHDAIELLGGEEELQRYLVLSDFGGIRFSCRCSDKSLENAREIALKKSYECKPGIGLLMQKLASAATFARINQKHEDIKEELRGEIPIGTKF
jgi:hypothetical protein